MLTVAPAFALYGKRKKLEKEMEALACVGLKGTTSGVKSIESDVVVSVCVQAQRRVESLKKFREQSTYKSIFA